MRVCVFLVIRDHHSIKRAIILLERHCVSEMCAKYYLVKVRDSVAIFMLSYHSKDSSCDWCVLHFRISSSFVWWTSCLVYVQSMKFAIIPFWNFRSWSATKIKKKKKILILVFPVVSVHLPVCRVTLESLFFFFLRFDAGKFLVNLSTTFPLLAEVWEKWRVLQWRPTYVPRM
jgi:hypothetical protein